jgi:hypothetical protein
LISGVGPTPNAGGRLRIHLLLPQAALLAVDRNGENIAYTDDDYLLAECSLSSHNNCGLSAFVADYVVGNFWDGCFVHAAYPTIPRENSSGDLFPHRLS